MHKLAVLIGLVAMLAMSATAIAARPAPAHSSVPSSVFAPRGMLPAIVHHADHQTMAAYRAALSSPEVLESVPCTCGCVASLGHEHNLDCYIDSVHRQGAIEFSMHGLNCFICQVITRDAVAGAAAGMTGEELHRMILERYSHGG